MTRTIVNARMRARATRMAEALEIVESDGMVEGMTFELGNVLFRLEKKDQ